MSDGSDYKIGKGKPPPWGQFKKGQSGNPKGRPRKKPKAQVATDTDELDRIYRRELDRQYDTKVGGEIVKLSALEIAVMAQIQAAAKGSPIAQREVLRNAQGLAARELELAEEAEREKREMFAKAVKYKEWRRRSWEAAERNGDEPEDYWPHPDDVLIDRSRETWRVRGPISDDDIPMFEYMEAGRDLAFLEEELALRRRTKLGAVLAEMWRLTWITYDTQLPLAWQLMPDLEQRLFDLALNDTRKLRRLRDQWEAEFEAARIAAGVPRRTKQVYREVNSIMKPLLQAQGYRSLAHFDDQWLYKAR